MFQKLLEKAKGVGLLIIFFGTLVVLLIGGLLFQGILMGGIVGFFDFLRTIF